MAAALALWEQPAAGTLLAGVDPADFRARVHAARRDAAPRRLLLERDSVSFVAAVIATFLEEGPRELLLGSDRWSEPERDHANVVIRRLAAAEVSPHPRLGIATGGTTGGLRFALHTWDSLAAAAVGLQAWLGGGPINSVCCLPLHHVSGLMQVVRAFVSGGQIQLADWTLLERGDLPAVRSMDGVISLVPTQLVRLLDRPAAVTWLRMMRAIFVGGAAADPALLARARQAGLRLAPCYGLTETAAQVTALAPEEFLAGRDDVGAPLPHAAVDVVDPASGTPVPAGVAGRIRVRSASLFSGYAGEVAPPTGGLVTGDRGLLDAAGHLTVLGRADRVINTGGEKVDPAEIEAAIRATGRAAAVAVCGVPDPEWGEAIVAVLAGAQPGVESILPGELRQHLAAHQIPKRWITVPALPLTAAGKIDATALKTLAANARPSVV